MARSVPPNLRALAYLHDTFERAGEAAGTLLELRLTDEERSVLALLTRDPIESYPAYVMRIASADGRAGRIARTIKLADLDDHLMHFRGGTRAPNYAWARRQVVASQRARGERLGSKSRTAQQAA